MVCIDVFEKLNKFTDKELEELSLEDEPVKLTEINPSTMESFITKDLYIVGELLDVDGECGGFNLGFAWISGYLAGREAARCIE